MVIFQVVRMGEATDAHFSFCYLRDDLSYNAERLLSEMQWSFKVGQKTSSQKNLILQSINNVQLVQTYLNRCCCCCGVRARSCLALASTSGNLVNLASFHTLDCGRVGAKQ